jgi:peptide/nickel transport system permease protein
MVAELLGALAGSGRKRRRGQRRARPVDENPLTDAAAQRTCTRAGYGGRMTMRPRGRRRRRPTRRQRVARDAARGVVRAPAPPAPVSQAARGPADELHRARREQLHDLLRSRTLLGGAAIVAFWVLCTAFGGLIAPHGPLATDPRNALAAPSLDHWFGTDRLGRDSFARVMEGGREILVLAPAAALLATVLGTTLGLVTGFHRGVVDDVLSRVFDALLALPVVVFGTVLLAALGSSRPAIIVAVAIPLSPIVARSVRAAVLAERELEYIDAARTRTESSGYIMVREVLPNVRAVVLVEFVVRAAYAVFAIATLGFVGLGVQPPTPDWGRQIFEHYSLLGGGLLGVWAVAFPVIAIASLVTGISLIVDGVTEAIDRSS